MPRKARKPKTAHLRDPEVQARAAASRRKTFALKRRAREEAAAAKAFRHLAKTRGIDRSGLREVSMSLVQNSGTKVSSDSAEGKTRLRMAAWLSKQATELLESVE